MNENIQTTNDTPATPTEVVSKFGEFLAEQKFAEAAAFGYQNYERLVAEAKASAGTDSTSTSAVKEHVQELQMYSDAVEQADGILELIRTQAFEVMRSNHLVALALYDALTDYTSNDLQEFRQHTLKFYKSEVAATDDNEEDVPFTKDELETLRSRVEALWTLAGQPEVEDLEVKTRKNGDKYIGFSRLPRGLDSSEDKRETSDSSVTTSRQVFYVNGERSAQKNLKGVALWDLSGIDEDGNFRLVTADEVRRAVEKQTGAAKYGESGEFSITVNGKTLERKREDV